MLAVNTIAAAAAATTTTALAIQSWSSSVVIFFIVSRPSQLVLFRVVLGVFFVVPRARCTLRAPAVPAVIEISEWVGYFRARLCFVRAYLLHVQMKRNL